MSPQLLRNSAWVIGGKIVIFGISFAFITALANIAPTEVAGSFQYIMATLAIVSIFTLPGMNTALVRAVSRNFEGSIRSMMRMRLTFGLIGSTIGIVIGCWYLSINQTLLGYAFLLSSLFVPFTDTWSEMTYSFFQGRKQFGKAILLALLCQFLFSIPSIIILTQSNNLIIVAGSFFLFQALAGYFVYLFVKPINLIKDHESEKLGFHLTTIGALRTIATNIDRVIVFQLLGPLSVAIYTFAAIPIMKLEQLIPIEMLALPDLTNQVLTLELRKKLFIRMLLLLLVIIPVIIVGVILTPFVFGILFPKFPESIPLFQVLMTGLIFSPFLLLKTGFTAWGRKRELYISETFSQLSRIVLMVIFGYLFGIYGIIAGIILSKLLESMMIAFLFAHIKTPPQKEAVPEKTSAN